MIQATTKPDPDEQSSIWIAKIERGLLKEELAHFDTWLLSNPDNVHRLLNLAAVWDELDVLAEPPKEKSSRALDRCALWSGRVVLLVTICAGLSLASVLSASVDLGVNTLGGQSQSISHTNETLLGAAENINVSRRRRHQS